MGAINCGSSHYGQKNLEYAGQYAEVTKSIFDIQTEFGKANSYVESLVLNERTDSRESLIDLKSSQEHFERAIMSAKSAKEKIQKMQLTLQPLYRQNELHKEFVDPYSQRDQDRAYEFWNKMGMVPGKSESFDQVKLALQKDGDLEYLKILNSKISSLRNVLKDLLTEYSKESVKEDAMRGKLQLSIRDADNKITALTASALTKISQVSTEITSFCLIEYSTHTSLTGKEISYEEYSVLENEQKKEAQNA
ncbi:hypothetical protein [Companilactobacillus paralimentarius]|uniref:hypothetical protein n=1 Tax=Companilactobacillus paralimentarius TaxID=83526 RepID=UPI00384AFE33